MTNLQKLLKIIWEIDKNVQILENCQKIKNFTIKRNSLKNFQILTFVKKIENFPKKKFE